MVRGIPGRNQSCRHRLPNNKDMKRTRWLQTGRARACKNKCLAAPSRCDGAQLKRLLNTIEAVPARAEFSRPTGENLMKDAHNKAAEHHESAAKSHRSAADSHGKNDHTKAKEHSTQARQQSQSADEQSKAAHEKSNQQK